MTTLLDIAKANAADPVVGLIEEAQKAVPEIVNGEARTIKGINFPTLVRTAVPSINFRSANKGTAVSGSTFENRLVTTHILNPYWEVDRAIAKAYEDGWEAWMAIEGAGVMEGSLQRLATQFYYGVASDSAGHPGLIDMYDSVNLVVDAGGTTADTGSSVWAVRWGVQDVKFVWGANGELELSEVTQVQVTDADGNKYTAYHQELLGWAGVQVGSKYSVGRIKKLTADAGKGLTDNLLYSLWQKFPVGKKPHAFFMSRRSAGQLRNSRTATNATGAPAPMPKEWDEGVKIYETDAILDTEPLSL